MIYRNNECLVPTEDVSSLTTLRFYSSCCTLIFKWILEGVPSSKNWGTSQNSPRKKKSDLVLSKVTITSIKGDSSANKRSLNEHLQAMISQQVQIFQTSVFTKGEVQLLCKAYGVSLRRSDSKAELSENLVPQIQGAQHFLHLTVFEESDDGHQPGPSSSAEDPPRTLQGKVTSSIFVFWMSTPSNCHPKFNNNIPLHVVLRQKYQSVHLLNLL